MLARFLAHHEANDDNGWALEPAAFGDRLHHLKPTLPRPDAAQGFRTMATRLEPSLT